MKAKHVNEVKAKLNAGDHSLLSDLFDVVQERVPHVYNGECPEPGHLEWRDKDCPACQVLLRVKAFLSTTAKVEDEASELIETIQRLSTERDALAERMACLEGDEPIGYMSDEDLAALREKNAGAQRIWPRQTGRNRNPLYVRISSQNNQRKD